MRAEGARRLATAAIVALSLHPVAGHAQPPSPDFADSARVGSPPDTTRTRIQAPAAPAASSIDLAAERKLGGSSFEDVLRLRRGVFVGALPVFGPSQGTIALPDGGGSVDVGGFASESEHATDEHLIGSVAYGWGAPWLAFAMQDPRKDGAETLDLDTLRFASPPRGFRAPGEALVRPDPMGPAFVREAPDTSGGGFARTTLVYRRGSGDAQLTGIRFQARVFRRDFFASFSRNQAAGWAPLRQTVSERYALRAELGRVGAHRFDLEGLIQERSIRDSIGIFPDDGGENEAARREVAVRATRKGERSSDAWRVRLATEKQTWILSPDLNVSPFAGSRERWEFPAVGVEGALSARFTPRVSGIVSAEASSRKIVYRLDSLPELEPRREAARVHLGFRHALRASSGLGIDGAYDLREKERDLWDARASIWSGSGRLRGRLDVESVHERASWQDLLTPPRLLSFVSPTFALNELFRSGDPGLEPRRLLGPLGSIAFRPAPGLDLEISGSYRRVTDDFGWNVTSDTTGGTFRVSSVAGERGSGWLSHVAVGCEFRRGPLRARGAGWIRGGPDSLSPQAGSPPRRSLDAAVDLRVVLFGGDLPLRFGVEAHARGPRRGLIREAGQITWDGSVSADFGAAAVFVRLHDAFDRRPGSAIWDPVAPSGSPLPGRTFHAGVSWNLLD